MNHFTPALAALAIVFGSTAVKAQTFQTANVAVPSTEIVNSLAQVCDGRFALSDNAVVACTKQSFPRLVSDGSRFVNTGIGGELNTLIRQLDKTSTN